MPAATRRVLFVESDESLRLLVQRVLGRSGIETDAAGEAPDAIRHLAAEKYQVVIIDLTANGGAAYEVVRALSLIPPGTRPIAIAIGDPAGDSRLDPEVVSLVLRKPYDVQALADIVSSSMSIEVGGGADAADEGLRL
jgi:CheY-like chemotaxis protein